MADLSKIDAKKIVEEMDRLLDTVDTNIPYSNELEGALDYTNEHSSQSGASDSFALMAGLLKHTHNNMARRILCKIMDEKFGPDYLLGMAEHYYTGTWKEPKFSVGGLPQAVRKPACYLARIFGSKVLRRRHILFGLVANMQSAICLIGSLYTLWLQGHKDYFMNEWGGTMEEARNAFLVEIVEQIIAIETQSAEPLSDAEAPAGI